MASLEDILHKSPKHSIFAELRTKDLITSVTRSSNKFSSLLIAK